MKMNKKFPLHFGPATKAPADIMSVILSLTQVSVNESKWKSNKCRDCLIKFIQLRDWGTISAELAQERQQAGVSTSAHAVSEMDVDGVSA